MFDWAPQIRSDSGFLYRGLADAIAEHIEAGRLRPGDRLPPQRRLAELLDVDLTTVSRGYGEVQSRRGFVGDLRHAGPDIFKLTVNTIPMAAVTFAVLRFVPVGQAEASEPEPEEAMGCSD